MQVLVNFKICDNSKDCLGIPACPTEAFHWDAQNKTIAIDNSLCTFCGDCGDVCEVEAIKVPQNEQDFLRLKREIDEDPRSVSDLFVDRYGAEPVSKAFVLAQSKFDN